MQKFESTRNQQIQLEPSLAILQGLSDDGGLFVLRDFGFQKIDISQIINASYLEIAQMIFKFFLEDFSEEEIRDAVHYAYEKNFKTEEVTPLVKVGETHILELFHGPTSAFKDVGLTLLPQLMSLAIQKQASGKRVLILTATSGDTGKAALEGFKDVDNVEIMVFYPKGGVSAIQELQMKTQTGKNVSICAVEGNFDQVQSEIKRLFLEDDFKKQLAEKNIQLSSANSINIGRLIPQIVYYFSAYAQMVRSKAINIGDEIDFVVPTGNFGNILAGYYAKKLGLPIGKLICASNENNVLHEFISTGCYNRQRAFLQTNSPSMDILISSNLERLLYDLSGQDHEQVKEWMAKLHDIGNYQLPQSLIEEMQQIFASGYASQEKTKEIIKEVYQKDNYLLDPHSAVAYKVWKDLPQERPTVILATASPYKFVQTVSDAINQTCQLENEFQMMEKLYEETQVKIPENLASLEELEINHQDDTSISGMKEFIFKRLDREV